MAFVRKSKFRHVFGQSAKKESCYEGFRVTNCRFEGSFIAANEKWIAFCVESEAGGAFSVIPVERKGRLNKRLMNVEIPKIIAHKKYVLDMQWNPYDDNMITTCSEDGCIRIWKIPDNGITKNWQDDKALVTLDYHERRCVQVQWHPIASNILFSVSHEPKICIWNLDDGVVEVEIGSHPDIIWNASWSNRGNQIVSSCKDKKFRIFDARSGVLMLWGHGHDGSRGQRVIFTMNDNYLLSCGFSSSNERQVCVWKVEDMSELNMVQLDNASGCLIPYYDADTEMVYLAAKGDSVIRYYELVDEQPYIHYISTLQSTVAQRGLSSIPKRSVNVNDNEVMRFYKLRGSQSGFIEPISMFVPRMSDIFHYDLYPDAIGTEAALDATEWFQGKNCSAKRIDMSSKYVKTKKILCSGGLKNKVTSLNDNKDTDKSSNFQKSDDGKSMSVVPSTQDAINQTPPSSPVGNMSIDMMTPNELEEEIYAIRKRENEKDHRIKILLNQLHTYERTVGNIRVLCEELREEPMNDWEARELKQPHIGRLEGKKNEVTGKQEDSDDPTLTENIETSRTSSVTLTSDPNVKQADETKTVHDAGMSRMVTMGEILIPREESDIGKENPTEMRDLKTLNESLTVCRSQEIKETVEITDSKVIENKGEIYTSVRENGESMKSGISNENKPNNGNRNEMDNGSNKSNDKTEDRVNPNTNANDIDNSNDNGSDADNHKSNDYDNIIEKNNGYGNGNSKDKSNDVSNVMKDCNKNSDDSSNGKGKALVQTRKISRQETEEVQKEIESQHLRDNLIVSLVDIGIDEDEYDQPVQNKEQENEEFKNLQQMICLEDLMEVNESKNIVEKGEEEEPAKSAKQS